jgi:acetolactate synthase-1/2/3 large subunit
VDAGTANAAMGMHNLMRTRLPVMLMAGRAPFTLHGELPGGRDTYVHFVQDPFDIGSLVRPYLKWEYNLPSGVVAKEAVRRGHTLMHSDPAGPVYLTLPRETLAESWAPAHVASYPADRYGAAHVGGLTREAAAGIARDLVAAEHPLAVTCYLGRKAEAVAALESLAQLCGIRVVEFNSAWLSMSRESPCFAGFDAAPLLPRTDLGLLLDVDVPWIPSAKPRADTRWLHLDVDPVKKDFPMWGFATHLRHAVDCAQALRDVEEAVRAIADDTFRARVATRMAAMDEERRARRDKLAAAEADPGSEGAINPAWACARLHARLDPEDVVVNEGIRNAPVVFNHMPRTQPLTMLGGAGGGLGYSAGMALGIKLARPQSRVVHVEGDGGFHFSTPTSVYAVAQAYRLPILTVVLDNGGWDAVKQATLRVHPDGPAARSGEFQSRLSGEHRHFEQVAQAFGGHGERVERPEQLEDAITRCLQAVDNGRAALLSIAIPQL